MTSLVTYKPGIRQTNRTRRVGMVFAGEELEKNLEFEANNPGTLTPRDIVLRTLNACKGDGSDAALFVVDENDATKVTDIVESIRNPKVLRLKNGTDVILRLIVEQDGEGPNPEALEVTVANEAGSDLQELAEEGNADDSDPQDAQEADEMAPDADEDAEIASVERMTIVIPGDPNVLVGKDAYLRRSVRDIFTFGLPTNTNELEPAEHYLMASLTFRRCD